VKKPADLDRIKLDLAGGHILAKLLKERTRSASAAAAYLGMRNLMKMGPLEVPKCEHVFSEKEQENALAILLHDITSSVRPK